MEQENLNIKSNIYSEEEKIFEEEKILEDALSQIEFKSVLEFIARFCYSELGKEIILKLRPFDAPARLRKELMNVEEMTFILTQDNPLPFDGLSDIRDKLYKSLVQNAVLSSTDILKVCDSVRVFRLIKSYFQSKQESYPTLKEETEQIHENRLLEKHIADAIDDSGEVRDNATKELHRIRREIREKSARLRARLQKILKRVSEEEMVQEEFISLREGRFVLPVKAEHKRHIPGIIHGVSQTGATVFMEPSEIIEMNNELSLLFNEEKREIYKILSNLTAEIGEDARQFLSSVEIISHIDSVYAKARYALETGGIKPDITEDNEIYLDSVRHPLLVHSKGIKKVMPLTIEFSAQIRGHLISGPNAGGKTVALKSIGLNIAMALSGIFPLGICRTNYRQIYASIGDHQSIENDLSTFSSQIIQLRDILSWSSPQSLILIDEIGSGTDPQEGAALAAGVLDSLLEVKSFFVATTHQSSLKTYALSREEIDNASLEFDEKELKPTYKFLQGIPGNSYAFVLAKSFGIPQHVLNRSSKYLGSRQRELEESIAILQRYKFEAESFRLEAEQEKIKAEKVRKDYEQKYKEVKEKRSTILDEARQEAYEIVRNANALIENTIREVKEEKRSIAEIKEEYHKEKKIIEKKIKEQEKQRRQDKPEEDFNVGDIVLYEDSQNTGTILEIDEESRTALVDFNGVKFRLAVNQLFKSDKSGQSHSDYKAFVKFDVQTTLDIRGKRAYEVMKELDGFISDAIVANAPLLTIIHGKGTGALRQVVHEFLANHPTQLKFRLGELVEGGAGVTIVEL